MSLIKKIKIKPLLLMLVPVAIYSMWRDSDSARLHEELIGKTTAYEQLSATTAKLKIDYVTQAALLKEVESNWAQEKKALKGRIKLLSNATYLIQEKARETNNSDIVYNSGEVNFILNEIRFENGPPVGYVLIFDDGRVVSKIYDHEIDVKTAVARDENLGTYSVVSKADWVLRNPHLSQRDGVDWFGKPHPLNIVGGTALIDPTEPVNRKRKFMWSPQGSLGVSVNKDINPKGGISLAGYGENPQNLTWKFLQFDGIVEDNSIKGGVTPVLFRPLPKIFKNTYVGPEVGFDGTLSLGISLGL